MLAKSQLEKSQQIRKRAIVARKATNFLFNQFRFFGSRKLGRFISKLLLPKLGKEGLIIPTIYGFDMLTNNNGGLETYYLGFYEVGTLHVIEHCLNENDNFIDVGASIGLMSLVAAKNNGNGKVFSFEPQSERFTYLDYNVQLNKQKIIKIFNNGLGKTKDSLKLYTDVNSPSIVDSNNNTSAYETIDILVLDEILEKEGIETVKLIKIDVEGFEIPVLQGAERLLSSADAPIICVEYVKRLQKQHDNTASLFEYIKGINDYKIFQLQKSTNTISKLVERKTENELRDFDNIFCFTPKHFKQIDVKELF